MAVRIAFRLGFMGAVCLMPLAPQAQFAMQYTGTEASLRGIYAVNDQVAWASGTSGTVLKTKDGGSTWNRCTTPQGAEELDFRGVQAYSAQEAVVMSSGKGDLSRIYRTTDGCRTWKLVFTNPDADGFFDAIVMKSGKGDRPQSEDYGYVVGDPVNGRISLFLGDLRGEHWRRHTFQPRAQEGEGLFAASNSSANRFDHFVTGGLSGPRIFQLSTAFEGRRSAGEVQMGEPNPSVENSPNAWLIDTLPLAKGESAGAFSLGTRGELTGVPRIEGMVVVGGNYKKPNESKGTAAYFSRAEKPEWLAARTPPHGYRSSVAYDDASKSWIAVGPNGTDVSTDDGANWHALRPSKDDVAGADSNWNALSLPFVVGPKGRIGRLRALSRHR